MKKQLIRLKRYFYKNYFTTKYMLKTELHTHIKGDPLDYWLKYDVYELINKAKKQNFDVLAITCHNKLFEDKKAIEYAKNKNILIIPGIERDIEGKHTLIYNATKEIEKIKTIKELKEYKKRNPQIFIIAPHSLYPYNSCHKKNIIKHLDLFDAWEYSFFYCKLFNYPNKKVTILSKKYKKPIVGNSDIHELKHLGMTYTLIDSDKKIDSIFTAIKNNKVKIISKPLKTKEFLRIIKSIIIALLKKK